MKAMPLVRFIGPIFLLTFFLLSCGDDGSGVNSFEQTPETSLLVDDANSSSSVDVLPSSAMVNESSSSENLDESSSSAEPSSLEKKELLSSSAEKEKSSSSEVLEESSSSMKNENSSSSVKTEESSSAEIFEESSSSVKNESSSSNGDSSSTEISSSSTENKSSSSSNNTEESSSSEFSKLNWKYLNPSIPYDTIMDSRDGQVYKVVTIGNQTWMAENLNYYEVDQNNYLIDHSWCYNNIESNCSVHGRLYDVSAALGYDQNQTRLYSYLKSLDTNHIQGICPDGWRIPLVSDLEKINNYARTALVSSSYPNWTKGNNSTGLSLIPSGYAYFYNNNRETNPDILFQNINKLTNLLSATYYGLVSSVQVLTVTNNSVEFSKANFVNAGYSVRCIKDN